MPKSAAAKPYAAHEAVGRRREMFCCILALRAPQSLSPIAMKVEVFFAAPTHTEKCSPSGAMLSAVPIIEPRARHSLIRSHVFGRREPRRAASLAEQANESAEYSERSQRGISAQSSRPLIIIARRAAEIAAFQLPYRRVSHSGGAPGQTVLWPSPAKPSAP